MTVYPQPCKDSKCDLNDRVNFVWRWSLRKRNREAEGKGDVAGKGIQGGVWNSYSTRPIQLTLLENDRNKLFPILASPPLCSPSHSSSSHQILSLLSFFPAFLYSIYQKALNWRSHFNRSRDSPFLFSLFPGSFSLSSSVHIFHS